MFPSARSQLPCCSLVTDSTFLTGGKWNDNSLGPLVHIDTKPRLLTQIWYRIEVLTLLFRRSICWRWSIGRGGGTIVRPRSWLASSRFSGWIRIQFIFICHFLSRIFSTLLRLRLIVGLIDSWFFFGWCRSALLFCLTGWFSNVVCSFGLITFRFFSRG